jgi:peptidoglycan hydrolase-like protein with peptidoglycan-binding domain
MNEKDVHKIKTTLNKLGYYEMPDYGITPYPDARMFDGIKSFQKVEKLKVDGIIKPKGETIVALNKKVPLDLPEVRGPTFWCVCGAPHGGVFGDLCKDCYYK